MTFDQQTTILVTLRIYQEKCVEQNHLAKHYTDYFEKELVRIEDAEKIIKAMEVEHVEES